MVTVGTRWYLLGLTAAPPYQRVPTSPNQHKHNQVSNSLGGTTKPQVRGLFRPIWCPNLVPESRCPKPLRERSRSSEGVSAALWCTGIPVARNHPGSRWTLRSATLKSSGLGLTPEFGFPGRPPSTGCHGCRARFPEWRTGLRSARCMETCRQSQLRFALSRLCAKCLEHPGQPGRNRASGVCL